MREFILTERQLLMAAAVAMVTFAVAVMISLLISRIRRSGAANREDPVATDSGKRSAGFGAGAMIASFLIGAVVGVGGMAIAARDDSVRLAVSALIDDGFAVARQTVGIGSSDGGDAGEGAENGPPPPPPEAPPAPASSPAAPQPQADAGMNDAAADPQEVEARLAVFTENLAEGLPRPAGPEFALTSVESEGMMLSLDYSVDRELRDEEVPAFNAYIMRTVKSLFCGAESREIRYLNQNGVMFHMSYTDVSGESVAKLTVTPDFCA